MGWPAAGGSRHAEPVQGSGAAAVWQRDRRRTYQCVPREHLQQRDEVVSIPQVLVEVVDVTLRLQGWGWRYGGAGGTAEPCRALAPPLLCRPPCLTPAGTKTGQPGWEPSDPPMCSRHSHVSPSAAWCPQRRVPTASTHRHPPHALRTSGRAGSGITPPHAGTRCPPCRQPWGLAPAWGGEGVRRKRAWWGQPERERPTSARQCCAGRGREKRERLGDAAERRQPQGGQGAAGTCPRAAAPHGSTDAAGPMPQGRAPGMWGHVHTRGPGRRLGTCQALTWGSARRAAGTGTGTPAGPWRGSSGRVAQAARGRSRERGTAGDGRAGWDGSERGRRCRAQAARWAWLPRGRQEGRGHPRAQRKPRRCQGGEGGQQSCQAPRHQSLQKVPSCPGLEHHPLPELAWHAWEGAAGSSRLGPMPGTATGRHSRAGEARRQGRQLLPARAAGAAPSPRAPHGGSRAASTAARLLPRRQEHRHRSPGEAVPEQRCQGPPLPTSWCALLGWHGRDAAGDELVPGAAAGTAGDFPLGQLGFCRRRRVPVP